ncbi:SE-cephalotoxin-like [Myripristis murdjan]|uniref:SE-cephalotoxin-like n=1 Tax=Myripristis murdjan TaxID=586833 RepID=UPI0011760DFC|nr:SE-cephalotoxin-like [Myripristis murdjan]
MAFLRVSLLLVFLTLLYWTTTSALSHDPTINLTNSRPPTRVKRALPHYTKERTKEFMESGKAALAVVKDAFGFVQTTKTLVGITKKIAQGMSMLPSVVGLIFSVINIILGFFPQESPMKQLQADLDEVNRKLDSLSMEISNLATDVEWHNYASVYSQDEVRILNAWKNFNVIFNSSMSAQSEEKKIRLAEMFTTFYENTATEGSVASLYHYLTVRGTSLSKNLLDILTRKSKCSIYDIGMYSIYFNSLMYRGMFLNQVYWSLMGFNTSVKAAEYTSMMKKIVNAEKEAVNYCKTNYMEFVKMEVVEISKKYSKSDKKEIAEQIKWALDKKYFWYSWVVVVYDTEQDYPDKTDGFTVIPMKEITVAVGRTDLCKSETPCMNNGTCKILLESNQWECECPDGYDGYTCEKQTPTFSEDIKKLVSEPLPAISTIDTKLNKISDTQSTLKKSLDKIFLLLTKRKG